MVEGKKPVIELDPAPYVLLDKNLVVKEVMARSRIHAAILLLPKAGQRIALVIDAPGATLGDAD